MHLDDCSGISLLRLPFEPRGQRTVISAAFNARQSPEDQARCRQVYDGLSPRLKEVLRAFADGLSPKEVAQKLCIAEKTVQDHRRAIFDQCAIAWELPPDHGLRYTWLREKFAPFLEV
jgi:CRISPR-associated protein Csx14